MFYSIKISDKFKGAFYKTVHSVEIHGILGLFEFIGD